MKKGESETPAWMQCEDIFNRIRTELITEAMDVLQDVIDSKAIGVEGSLISLPEKPSDTEMRMFIINNIIKRKDEIIQKYSNYLENDSIKETNPFKVEQRERLRRFLLSIEQISLLMQYSTVIASWMHDMSMQVMANDPSEVIKGTMPGEELRREILRYVVASRKMEKERIFSEEERKILKKSIS